MNKTAQAVIRAAIADKTDYLRLCNEDVARKRSSLTETEARAFVLLRDIENLKASLDENR